MARTRHTVNTTKADTHRIKDTGNHSPISIIKVIPLSRATTKDNPSHTVNKHMDSSNPVTESNHLMANNHNMANNPMTNIHKASNSPGTSSRGSNSHMANTQGLDQKVHLAAHNRATVASEAL
jgi:hypothetical protein